MSALVTTDEDFLARFEEDPLGAAITKLPPAPKFCRLGINQMGQLYEYGERPGIPKRVFTDPEDGLEFLGIHDIKAVERAGEQRKTYLDVTFGSLHPVYLYVLSLPVFNASPDCSSWAVRTLLGSLTLSCKLLDLRAMSGKLFTRRGTRANFVDLYAYGSPTGEALARITADAIDGDRHSFEIAVNNLRRALDLEPQFP